MSDIVFQVGARVKYRIDFLTRIYSIAPPKSAYSHGSVTHVFINPPMVTVAFDNDPYQLRSPVHVKDLEFV